MGAVGAVGAETCCTGIVPLANCVCAVKIAGEDIMSDG